MVFICFTLQLLLGGRVGSSFTKLFKDKGTLFCFWVPSADVCQNIVNWCWFWSFIALTANYSSSLRAVGSRKRERKPFYALSILLFAFQPVCLDCTGTIPHLVEKQVSSVYLTCLMSPVGIVAVKRLIPLLFSCQENRDVLSLMSAVPGFSKYIPGLLSQNF